METVASPDGLLDGRWQVGDVLGRGAVADVFAGHDASTGHEVAVKVVRVAEGDAVRRFEREVAALEGVDHPGIVAVLGHGELGDGRPYVVLERAGGGTLADALAAGALGSEAAARLGAQLARALHHAHGRGVVHRDVKPANVLLDAGGRPMLADFGIAHLVGAGGLTVTGWAVGTPAYLAPEQLRGEAVGPPADVYALGLVVLEAATGERAFPGNGVASALARLERPLDVPSSVPGGLASVIRSMTAEDPAARPDAAEAARRLDASDDAGETTAVPVASTATAVIPVAPAPPPAAVRGGAAVERAAPARSRRSARPAVVVAAVAAVLALAAVLSGALSTGDWSPAEAPTTTSTTAVVTTAPAPASTAPPATDGGGRGQGGGNGNGNGRGNGDGNGRGG